MRARATWHSAPLDPIDETEDELQSAFRRVGVALPEPGIQDVAFPSR